MLKQESFPEDAEISLVVTDAEEVHRLNLEFRGIDRTTDVLSFPGLDFEEPAAFEDSIDEGCINPDNDCVMLGDIVINAEKVKEQAAEYGHSEMREFAFLIAHSMLHLCGYDPPVRVRPYDSGGSGSYGGETGEGTYVAGDHKAVGT